MRLILVLAAFVVASWLLRRRPDIAALVILSLWILIPSIATEVVTGVPHFAASALNLHPAAWLTYIYLAIMICAGSLGTRTRLGSLPAELSLLAWVMLLAVILTLTQLEQASL